MFVTRIGEHIKYVISGYLEQSDIKKSARGLEDAINRFAGVHGVGLSMFKEKDIVRHSLVRRLLKRYKDDFKLSDAPAEMTISQWLKEFDHDNYVTDGSDENFYYNVRENGLQ